MSSNKIEAMEANVKAQMEEIRLEALQNDTIELNSTRLQRQTSENFIEAEQIDRNSDGKGCNRI